MSRFFMVHCVQYIGCSVWDHTSRVWSHSITVSVPSTTSGPWKQTGVWTATSAWLQNSAATLYGKSDEIMTNQQQNMRHHSDVIQVKSSNSQTTYQVLAMLRPLRPISLSCLHEILQYTKFTQT